MRWLRPQKVVNFIKINQASLILGEKFCLYKSSQFHQQQVGTHLG